MRQTLLVLLLASCAGGGLPTPLPRWEIQDLLLAHEPRSVAVSADGRVVVLAQEFGVFRLQPEEPTLRRVATGPNYRLLAVAQSEPLLLAAVQDDRVVLLGQETRIVTTFQGQILSLDAWTEGNAVQLAFLERRPTEDILYRGNCTNACQISPWLSGAFLGFRYLPSRDFWFLAYADGRLEIRTSQGNSLLLRADLTTERPLFALDAAEDGSSIHLLFTTIQGLYWAICQTACLQAPSWRFFRLMSVSYAWARLSRPPGAAIGHTGTHLLYWSSPEATPEVISATTPSPGLPLPGPHVLFWDAARQLFRLAIFRPI